MEKTRRSDKYFEFVQRLEESKQKMLEMGFEENGLNELVEEMREIAIEILEKENVVRKVDVEGWENEGGFVPDDDVVQC